MGKKTKVTASIETYVRERRRHGLSHRAIVEELRARGTPLSLGAVHKIAPATHTGTTTSDGRVVLNPGTRAQADTQTRPPPPEAAALAATSDDALAGDVVPADADMATLEALHAKWSEMSAKADETGNLSAYIALQRLIRDVVVQKRKFRAPPAERPEDNPDMVRAGDEAASMLHQLIDQALKAGAS